MAQRCCLLIGLIYLIGVQEARKYSRISSIGKSITRGTQCYNCISYDDAGCWNPEHPAYNKTIVPNTDCYIPGMKFLCIVITAEAAKLVTDGNNIGPVRARTCVPAKDFPKMNMTYAACDALSSELAYSEIFTRVVMIRPQCSLCKDHYCTGRAVEPAVIIDECENTDD